MGTRAADPSALRAGRDIGRRVAELGCGVVSGGAMGVDAAAHWGALEAGGVSVAILAGGVDRPSPRRNATLFEALLSGPGGIWSERPPGTRPARWAFPRRNRLIAAAARLVVVVQARRGSGSLLTAEHAQRLRRPLAVAPSGWRDVSREGCADLLRRGATPLMGEEDLDRLLEASGPRLADPPQGDEGRALDLLRAGALGPDGIADATGWEVPRCLALMTALEVGGWWTP